MWKDKRLIPGRGTARPIAAVGNQSGKIPDAEEHESASPEMAESDVHQRGSVYAVEVRVLVPVYRGWVITRWRQA